MQKIEYEIEEKKREYKNGGLPLSLAVVVVVVGVAVAAAAACLGGSTGDGAVSSASSSPLWE